MKVCSFCNSENDDATDICASCGSREFKHRCENCGNLFDQGNFCPSCGVRVGTKPKICENCGSLYFSLACPNCGFIKNSTKDFSGEGKNEGELKSEFTNKTSYRAYSNTANSKTISSTKKRNKWLWILGWLLIFPLPLTIILTRKKMYTKNIRRALISLAWILYILILISYDDSSNTEEEKQNKMTPNGSVANYLVDFNNPL